MKTSDIMININKFFIMGALLLAVVSVGPENANSLILYSLIKIIVVCKCSIDCSYSQDITECIADFT